MQVAWPVKSKTQSPVWNSARELGVRVEDEKTILLHLEMWHKEFNSDVFIGEVGVSEMIYRS